MLCLSVSSALGGSPEVSLMSYKPPKTHLTLFAVLSLFKCFWWAKYNPYNPDSISFDLSDLDNFKSQTVRSAVNVREGQGVVLLCGPPVNSGGECEIITCQSCALIILPHLHAYLWIHKESFPFDFWFISVKGQCDILSFLIWQSLFLLAFPFVPWLIMLDNLSCRNLLKRLSVTARIISLSRKLIMLLKSVLIYFCT